MSLGYAGGNRADTDFGHQLDADARTTVGIFQIMDQLCEILDGVDIMVRRRRNQADTGRSVAGLGDPGIDLGSGQFAPLTRLGPLSHLDLQFTGIGQVVTGDAEASRSYLLDGAVF